MLRLFGAKLRLLRTTRQLSQEQLAHQLELRTHAHITNLEQGRRQPSLNLILIVARQFSVSTDYLLCDSKTVDPPLALSTPIQAHPPEHFGEKLRILRQKADLSQAQLAQKLSLRSHRHVSHLETGKKEPSIDLVLRIADTFNVSTGYLLIDSMPIEQ